MDGYDKFKLFGFVIYGVIDGFSRKILWFEVVCFNSLLDSIVIYYLNIVKEFEGCLVWLIIDLGIENGLVVLM